MGFAPEPKTADESPKITAARTIVVLLHGGYKLKVSTSYSSIAT